MVNFTTQSNVQSHPPRAARHCRADRNRHSMSNRLSWSSQHITHSLNQGSNMFYCTVQEKKTGDTSTKILFSLHTLSFIYILHTCGHTFFHPVALLSRIYVTFIYLLMCAFLQFCCIKLERGVCYLALNAWLNADFNLFLEASGRND